MLEEKLVVNIDDASPEMKEKFLALFSSHEEIEVASFKGNDDSFLLLYSFTLSTEIIADICVSYLGSFPDSTISFENEDDSLLMLYGFDCYGEIVRKISIFRRRFLYNTIMAKHASDLNAVRKRINDTFHKQSHLSVTLNLIISVTLEIPYVHLKEFIEYIDNYQL